MVVLLLAVLITSAGSASAKDNSILPPGEEVTVTTVPTNPPEGPMQQSDPVAQTPALSQYPVLDTLQTQVLQETKHNILKFRGAAWHWQRLMGRRITPSSFTMHDSVSVSYAKWVMALWEQRSHKLQHAAQHWMADRIQQYRLTVEHWRLVMGLKPVVRTLATSGSVEQQFLKARRLAHSTYQQYMNPPQKGSFLCIHGYEGSWSDKDSGGNGHYGGVQFGKSEWLRFGYPYTGKLWAYEATPLEQLWAAYRYWQVSGFYPWPQTARNCGLI